MSENEKMPSLPPSRSYLSKVQEEREEMTSIIIILFLLFGYAVFFVDYRGATAAPPPSDNYEDDFVGGDYD